MYFGNVINMVTCMKKIIFTLGILLLCAVSGAQTPYYYYYEGKKQYLELNTEYAFLSVSEQQLPANITRLNINYGKLYPDKSDKKIFLLYSSKSNIY